MAEQEMEPEMSDMIHNVFPEMEEDELAELHERVSTDSEDVQGEGTAEGDVEAEAIDGDAAGENDGDDEENAASGEDDDYRASIAPAVDEEKEQMREALRLLGYEDQGDRKGWEEAIAEMKGLSVEELRASKAAATDEAYSQKEKYAEVESAELAALKEAFPQLAHVQSLKDIPHFGQFALERYNRKGVVEAYAAASGETPRIDFERSGFFSKSNGKEHLRSSATKRSSTPVGMTREEFRFARETFGDKLSDKELADLYRKVSK